MEVELGFWLPEEFFDEDMFLAAEKQIPAATAAVQDDQDAGDDYIGDLSRRMTIPFITDDDEDESNPKVTSMASSPQSTLRRTTNPSIPSQVSSPPSTPSAESSEDALELLRAAAGEIASGVAFHEQRRRQWMAQQKLTAAARASNIQQIQRLRQEQLMIKQHRSAAVWSKQSRGGVNIAAAGYLHGRNCGRSTYFCSPSAGWPHYPPRRQTYPHGELGSAGLRSMFLYSSGGRESTGTGVFIPKLSAAGNPSEPSKKKSGGCSTINNVGRAVNLHNPDEIAGHPRCPPAPEMNHHPAAFSFIRSDFPPLPPSRRIADRQNSLLHCQKKGLLHSHAAVSVDENRLPAEWSY